MKWNGYIYFPACFCCSFWQHIEWWKSNWSGLIVQNKILFHSAQWRIVHQFCDVLRFGWWGIIFYLNQISFHINQSLTGVDKVSMSMAAGMMIMLVQPCTKNMMATVNQMEWFQLLSKLQNVVWIFRKRKSASRSKHVSPLFLSCRVTVVKSIRWPNIRRPDNVSSPDNWLRLWRWWRLWKNSNKQEKAS